MVSESKGIENLFDEKLPNVKMGSRMNYEKIADMEGIDVELIRGKNWSEIRAIIAAVRDKADGGRVGFKKGGWDPGVGRDKKGYKSDHSGDWDPVVGRPYHIPKTKTKTDDKGSKLAIGPVFKTKSTDLLSSLIGPYPTDIGLAALSKYGKLDATLNIKDLIGGDINPTITGETAIGPVNLTGTYSDDEQTLEAQLNKGPFNARVTYNAITGDPEYWAGYSKTFKDGGRIGFQGGGSGNWWDGLTGQGLALYNSMTAGGHGDETIQDTLKQLGYWGGDTTGIQTITNTQSGITQGGGDGGGGSGVRSYTPLSERKTVPATNEFTQYTKEMLNPEGEEDVGFWEGMKNRA